ncbi:hypothetical protein TSUD_35600 [Trifolium subterraneum]|uniref:mannan endo-1,4-beta-mannosidase n=1 Tax=Trifolium subterraneum TaxID=3900 RepID=A0A2Z6MKA2_TRISU|nr:hypothetical protein TSUD_35600 [Trifolium subterraneum]
MASNPSTRFKVTSTFEQASKHGLNVGRTMAFNDGVLQISPGSYDENVFKGLDFVIAEARKYGVQLILSLVNNWENLGGKKKYVQWARERGQNVKNDDDFFTNSVVKQYYKNYVKTVLTRNNTINGMLYKDDPTIFAWELINEPECQDNSSGKSIQNWVNEMAVYVKSIDSNHLLEIGLEGFYGETMPQKKQFNPNSFPPIIIGEFGKSSKTPGYNIAVRDNYYKKIYNAISTSAISEGSCAGGIFWQLLSQGMDSYGDGFEVIFENSPSTAEIIKLQSIKMSNIK